MVGIQEVVQGMDAHTDNQKRLGLPEGKPGRLIAKIFLFRLIYGGSAYSYANDPDFMTVSSKEDFWQGAIDKFYQKYQGIKKWHDGLKMEARRTGQITVPSGVQYKYEPEVRRGIQKWPDTTILNYPVNV